MRYGGLEWFGAYVTDNMLRSVGNGSWCRRVGSVIAIFRADSVVSQSWRSFFQRKIGLQSCFLIVSQVAAKNDVVMIREEVLYPLSNYR